MPALSHRSHSDFTVRVAWCRDVDEVKFNLRYHLVTVSENLCIGMQLLRFLTRSLRRRGNRHKSCIWILSDRLRMEFSPRTKTGESKADGLHIKSVCWHLEACCRCEGRHRISNQTPLQRIEAAGWKPR